MGGSEETGGAGGRGAGTAALTLFLLATSNLALASLVAFGSSTALRIVSAALWAPVAFFSYASAFSAVQTLRGLHPIVVTEWGLLVDHSWIAGRTRSPIAIPIKTIREFIVKVGTNGSVPYAIDVRLVSGRILRTGWRNPGEAISIVGQLRARWPDRVSEVSPGMINRNDQ